MKKQLARAATPMLLFVFALCTACRDEGPGQAQQVASVAGQSRTVTAEISPFDLFPSRADYGFSVRFSHSVGSRGGARESMPPLRLTPAVEGVFLWTSDSQIDFHPRAPLPADSKYTVSLESLVLPEGLTLKQKELQVIMPEPMLRLASCELKKTGSDPIVKKFFAKLLLNHSVEGAWNWSQETKTQLEGMVTGHYVLKRRLGDGKEVAAEETIPLKYNYKNFFVEVNLSGNDMLRPGKDGSFTLTIEPGLLAVGGKTFPGASCSVPFKDLDWKAELASNLADSKNASVPSPAELTVSQTTSSRGQEELRVRFIDPINKGKGVPHKRPTNEVLERGTSIEPEVKGTWKVGPSDSELSFRPTAPWEPKRKYTVTIDKAEFPEVALTAPKAEFIAHALSATISQIDAGTVPEDPARRVVSATVQFNYPVDASALENLFTLSVHERSKGSKQQTIGFSLSQDEEKSRVFVKSSPLQLSEYPLIVTFTGTGSASSSIGGEKSALKIVRTYELPSKLDIFSITGTNLSVAKSASENLERILSISTSEDVDESKLSSSIELLLLPDCNDKANKKICDGEESFPNEAAITPAVQEASSRIATTFTSRTETGSEESFSYSFEAPGNRQVLLTIKPAFASKLGFPLKKSYREVLQVREYPKRLTVMLDGSLLSLSGNKRLGILAQNVRRIRYRLSRIKPTDLHHLIYFASESFKQPKLESSFTYDDVSQPIEFLEELPESPSGKPAYTSIDFSRFMAKAGDLPRGLFQLEVNEDLKPGEKASSDSDGEDSAEEEDSDEEESSDGSSDEDPEKSITSDSRLVLLTDLALIVKRELSGADTVYVASFRTGGPTRGASVKLLGRNGDTLFSAESDANGEVKFPKAGDFTREKEPVLYVAELDGDLTFLPYQARDRGLNLSRFNIGGIYNVAEPNALRALLFTDRGIYRPGETAKLALTVRGRDFLPLPADLPLSLRIADPKGEVVRKDSLIFPKLGLTEATFETSDSMVTGTYRAALVIPAKGAVPERELGGVEFRVEEFEPDKLSITAILGEGKARTFQTLAGLSARVTLRNLFGAPSVGNTVQANMRIEPWSGELPAYPGYNFRPRIEYQNQETPEIGLGEKTTTDSGEASFPISIPNVSGVVLDTVLTVEGFERDSGRSVATSTKGLLTDLNLLFGVRAGDALDYIPKGDLRRINLQAINLKGEKIASGDVSTLLERIEYKNILVKQPNGVYKYESARKLVPISTSTVASPLDGSTLELVTNEPGSFLLSFKDQSGTLINQIPYTVVGDGNDSIKISRNANLEVTLNKPSYSPGEEVELSIKAPYAGFGLITVEREKVLGTWWFRTTGTSSVQKIKVPASVVGNGYITVLLARAFDSKEIYVPPLSSASLPLQISETQYIASPSLSIASIVKPGESLTVRYTSSEAGALVVYAVDEGILQYGKYKTPDPLKSLLPKRALEVETRTALDLVMPDYSVVQSVLSPGGDGGDSSGKFQNPFKKKSRPPLAAWSGVRMVAAGNGEFSFPIPDYFDGSVKTFAYFVGEKRLGMSQGRTEVRGDFVIRPNLPTFTAPGDLIDLPVEITSNLPVAQEADVSITSNWLEITGNTPQKLTLRPSSGEMAHFKAKTLDHLGEATLTISVKGKSNHRTISDTISVRPASPLMRTVEFGIFDPEKKGDSPKRTVTKIRDMFTELRSSQGAISTSPGLLVDSLNQFMEGYPYGCSEQLTSKGMLALALLPMVENGELKDRLKGRIEKTVRDLASRMNADGSIAYWKRGDPSEPFVSMYGTHFLLDAQESGIAVPSWQLEQAQKYLKSKNSENVFDIAELYVQAYSLYLTARFGQVVTTELDSMVARLRGGSSKAWEGSALSSLVAATYAQLKLPKKAQEFSQPSVNLRFDELPFPLQLPALNSGFTSYLAAKHLGKTPTKDEVFAMLNRLDAEAPDSLSAASLALGFAAATSKKDEDVQALSISTDLGKLTLTGKQILTAGVPPGAKSVEFEGPVNHYFLYSLVQSGFDRSPQQQGERNRGVSLARDIVDKEGKSVTTFKLGETYRVTIRVTSQKAVQNFAVQDLFPAGFEPDLDALKDRRSVGQEADAWGTENVDIRDDRMLLFGDLSSGTVVFSYPLKPTSRGEFEWPGLYGEAMYDAKIFGWEKSEHITVE